MEKYNIIDVMQLTNPKISLGFNPLENEATFCTISYNANFGNLKICLSKLTKKHQESLKQLIIGSVDSSSIYRVFNDHEKEIVCNNQLISNTKEYLQSKQSFCKFKKISIDDYIINYWSEDNIKFQHKLREIEEEELIRMELSNTNTYFYDFYGWQKQMLHDISKHIIENGLILRGIVKIVESIQHKNV